MSGNYEFDLFDPKQTQNMWDQLAEMREKCPVAQPAEQTPVSEMRKNA